MKFKFLIAASLLCVSVSAFAQSWEAVTRDSRYVYGEGSGITLAEADKAALSDLVSKISVHVADATTVRDESHNRDGRLEYNTDFHSMVQTYSQATLNNTQKVILHNEPDARVGRYIARAEIERIFESRKAKIRDYVSSAVKAESKGKIDTALKDYYWALALLKSTRYPNELTYETEDGENVILLTWIPRKMNEIFDALRADFVSREGDDVQLKITYKGIPVSSIDYAYFDGRDWTSVFRAKDGVGTLELAPGALSDIYRVRFEYEYRGEAHVDPEVQSVLGVVPGTPMRQAYVDIKGNGNTGTLAKASTSKSKQSKKGKNDEEAARSEMMANAGSFSENAGSRHYSKPTAYDDADGNVRKCIDKITAAVKSKQYDSVRELFTDDAYGIWKKLVKYGQAKIVGSNTINMYTSGNRVYARGMQMAFSMRTGMRKQFVEDIVLMFNPEGKIENLSFGLDKTAEDDILCKGVWSETARFAIMDFLENYQTAYALKRLDYIADIFDDDAVIITAVVPQGGLQRVKQGDVNGFAANNIIRYNRYTKDEYIKHLKRSFASKEYINLRLGDNDVYKPGKGGETYAIQISQEYYSSNYGDKGYLFLIVDINDPEAPLIKVRTWQPEKDPNFGVYSAGDFN